MKNLIVKTTGPKPSLSSLSDRVHEKVKDMIIGGQLRPGEQIRQVQLAEQLNVSRTPLVNALQRLVSESYVTYHPGRGYEVRKFNQEEMLQLHRVREACEGVAAYDACDRITDKEIEEMRSLFHPFLEVTKWGPDLMVRYYQADVQFHQKVIGVSGNPFILQALDNLGIFYFTYQWGLLQFPEVSTKDHLLIIEALAARDHHAARHAMETHLMRSRNNIAQQIL